MIYTRGRIFLKNETKSRNSWIKYEKYECKWRIVFHKVSIYESVAIKSFNSAYDLQSGYHCSANVYAFNLTDKK